MNLIVKFFVSLASKFLDGLMRDKANRDLGASQQRESSNDATIKKQEDWADIDSKPVSVDDAFKLFNKFGRRDDGDSTSVPTSESSSDESIDETK